MRRLASPGGTVQSSPTAVHPVSGLKVIDLVVERGGKRIPFKVELADTPEAQARGLMFRDALGDFEGMIFPSAQPGPRSFWMKNTLIDLDIAFVARDGTVLEVRTMTAGETETTTSVTKEARFAVEMRAGWFRDFGVKPGDKVNLEDLRSAVRDRGFDVKKFLP